MVGWFLNEEEGMPSGSLRGNALGVIAVAFSFSCSALEEAGSGRQET